jgi:hypothetical protein
MALIFRKEEMARMESFAIAESEEEPMTCEE